MTFKTALVTGAAGFIGRNMTRYLQAAGYDVDQVDPLLAEDNSPHIFPMDMRDFLGQAGYVGPYDLVIHAAAMEPNRKAIDTQLPHFAENVHLDAALFRWAHVARPKRVVYLSSSAAYPTLHQMDLGPHKLVDLSENLMTGSGPDSVYGETKVLGEKLAQQLRTDGVQVTIVRPFSGYGPDQSEDFPFAALVGRVQRREDPVKVWGTGGQIRDWVHVDDVCRAILALAKTGEGGYATNICTGIGHSMREVIELTAQINGYPLGEIEPLDHEPHGVFRRVGDPTLMLRSYTPRWSLAAGIEQKLASSSI